MTNTMRNFWYGSLWALLLVACQSQTATEKTTDAPTIGEVTATPKDTDITATTIPEGITYQRRLVNQNYAVSVSVKGEEMMKDLQIEVLRAGKLVTEFTEQIDGQVAGSVTSDLNNNDKPEVLVFVESSGSGSYGLVYGYELSENGKQKITMPPLKGEAAKGYMGHDTFKVENGKLLRTFPIYGEADVNANPTGGTRTIEYTLTEQDQFTMAGFSDSK